jgi:ADP-heptose:LPS heptosyltransferase
MARAAHVTAAPTPAPASILVYSMGEVIGDGLIKLPFAAGLRAAFPHTRIAWAAAKGATVYATSLAEVVGGLIDEVVTAGPTGAAALDALPWVKPFGGRRFDLVIDTQENLRRSGVARRAVAKGGRFVSPVMARGNWPTAVVDRMAVLLAMAAPGARPAAVRLADPAIVAEAARLLPAGPSYIGFAPGAGGAEKRWPLERYIELARRQAGRGRAPVFFLGPQEIEAQAAIAAALPQALFPEGEAGAGLGGPRLVIALAGRLAAAVANDAGPGHMLAAGGAALLSLQKDLRKAAKFKPAAQRLEMLVAEAYGEGMAALSLEAADRTLETLLR